tara:strand:+ start:36 stop:218 length:183 start_codon:yes stop_codon:yes gene_type:complete
MKSAKGKLRTPRIVRVELPIDMDDVETVASSTNLSNSGSDKDATTVGVEIDVGERVQMLR